MKKASKKDTSPSFYQAVYRLVRAIPRGRVVAYGWVATWLGAPRAARAVGYALAANLKEDIPWQRVVNRDGEISVGGAVWRPERQLSLLRGEGIVFLDENRIDLKRFGYKPTSAQLKRWLAWGDQTRLRL